MPIAAAVSSSHGTVTSSDPHGAKPTRTDQFRALRSFTLLTSKPPTKAAW
jgi:hypothetical protein